LALRLVEIALPENEKHKLEELKDDISIELWQEDSINSVLKAKKASKTAVLLWDILLIILAVVIYLSQTR